MSNRKLLGIGLYLAISLMSLSVEVWAAGTPAGTVVLNHVEVSYQVGSDPEGQYVEKASHAFTVSELIQSNVTALEPQGIGTATPASNAVLSYQLTNTGNGDERFLLTTQAGLPEQFTPTVTGVWIESNGVAGWQSEDTLHSPSDGGVPLVPDQSEVVYVVSDIPAGVTDEAQSDVALISTSATNGASTKMMGQSLETGGDGGIEAVIAQDNASHQDASHYTVSTVRLDVEKTIVNVSDPYGGELSMPGSEVTYQIRVVASGSGVVSDFVVEDPVPESMTYKKGTLTMDGSALSDDTDSDNGNFDDLLQTAAFSSETIIAPSVHEYTLTYIIE